MAARIAGTSGMFFGVLNLVPSFLSLSIYSIARRTDVCKQLFAKKQPFPHFFTEKAASHSLLSYIPPSCGRPSSVRSHGGISRNARLFSFRILTDMTFAGSFVILPPAPESVRSKPGRSSSVILYLTPAGMPESLAMQPCRRTIRMRPSLPGAVFSLRLSGSRLMMTGPV